MKMEKFKLFFAKNRFINWFIVACLLVGVGSLIIPLIRSGEFFQRPEDAAGMIDTLFGAVVGGFFALLGSVVTNRSTQKAQAAREQSSTLFKPLYDELMYIHNVVLRDNPYPFSVEFDDNGPPYDPQRPQYCLWGKVKNDSRLFLAPQKLRAAMEKLYKKAELYADSIAPATAEINHTFRNALWNELSTNIDCGVDFGNLLLKSVMCNETPDYPSIMWIIGDIDSSQRDCIWKETYERCHATKEIKKLAKAKQEWAKQEDYVIELLANYIQYIEYRYER